MKRVMQRGLCMLLMIGAIGAFIVQVDAAQKNKNGAKRFQAMESAEQGAVGEQKENGGNDGHGFAAKELKDGADLDVMLGKPSVLLFYSKTCGACTMIKDAFNQFVQKYKERVDFWRVNTSAAGVKDLKQLFKIDSVPATVVIHKSVGGMEGSMYAEELAMMTGVNSGMQITSEPQQPSKPVKQAQQEKSLPAQPEMSEEEIAAYGMTDIPLSVSPEDIAPVEYKEFDLKLSPSGNMV